MSCFIHGHGPNDLPRHVLVVECPITQTHWYTRAAACCCHRYAELRSVLPAVVTQLLALDVKDSDGALVCGLAEASAKVGVARNV